MKLEERGGTLLSIIANPLLLSIFGCSKLNVALETLTHDGVERAIIHIPAAYDSSLEAPMLINSRRMHRCFQSRDEMDMRALADEHNYILVYQKAPVKWGR